MCQCDTTVILQGTQHRIRVDLIPASVEAASVSTVEIISLRGKESFVDKTISVRVGTGEDGIFDRHRGCVLENVASRIGSAGDVAIKSGVQDDRVSAIVESASIVAGAVVTDRGVGQFHREARMLDASAASCLILGERAVEHGQVAAVGDPAAGGRGNIRGDLCILDDGGRAIARVLNTASDNGSVADD